MSRFSEGWRVQTRVIGALMVREMITRFGRENIGFLWLIVEPLLFAGLVAVLWHYAHGDEEHGISVVTFVVSGYMPLVLFRHSVSRSTLLFKVNGSLLYHRQVKIVDFIFVRFLLEFIGHLIGYFFIGIALILTGLSSVPADFFYLFVGWFYYSFFALSFCFLLAPLSEMSEVVEKFVPVTTYIMVPFSGSFSMVTWLTPGLQSGILYSPPVHAMEMMRYGIFGNAVSPRFDYIYPLAFCSFVTLIGLALCRRVRRTLVVE